MVREQGRGEYCQFVERPGHQSSGHEWSIPRRRLLFPVEGVEGTCRFCDVIVCEWAGILGNAALVRNERGDLPETRRISQNLTMRYTNPLLSRICCESYNSEEVDKHGIL